MVHLGGAQRSLHWHVFIITWANAIVIALMVLVFLIALSLPYPGTGRSATRDEPGDDGGAQQ